MPRGEEGILKEGPSEEENNQDNERHNFATLVPSSYSLILVFLPYVVGCLFFGLRIQN